MKIKSNDELKTFTMMPDMKEVLKNVDYQC